MDKKQIFVLLFMLIGIVAADDAAVTADGATENDDELLDNVDDDSPDPAFGEAKIGTADGTIDPIEWHFAADVSTGIDPAEVPESDVQSDVQAAPSSEPAGTDANVVKIVYKWLIADYSHHNLKFGETLYSPVFSSENAEEYQWQLQFYPRGNSEKYKNHTSLYLASVGQAGAKPIVQFSIRDKDGKQVNVRKFKDQQFIDKAWGIPNFVEYDVLEYEQEESLLPGDKLTLLTEITFSPDHQTPPLIMILNGTANAEVALSAGRNCSNVGGTGCLAMPFSNHEYHDVQLILSSEVYVVPAVKAALAAHSTWFAEKLNEYPDYNSIMLPQNFKPAEVEAIVKFIHTGDVDPDMALDLRYLAGQLGMPKLRAMCDEVFCKYRAPEKPESAPTDEQSN